MASNLGDSAAGWTTGIVVIDTETGKIQHGAGPTETSRGSDEQYSGQRQTGAQNQPENEIDKDQKTNRSGEK